MAALGIGKSYLRVLLSNKTHLIRCIPQRLISSTLVNRQTADDQQGSWVRNLFVRKIETPKESQSHLLSDRSIVYELQFHSVKPECMEGYIKQFESFNNMMLEKKTGSELVGSWTVEFGDQDEAVHLWKYVGGYPMLNSATEIYRTDKDFLEFRKARNLMLRHRTNQINLAFSYWPFAMPRTDGNHIYELRSYVLKPGTMIEWGNNWARGLQYRKNLEQPIAGLFSHIGEMYTVHHIWAYKDLQTRKEQREAAWSMPGWDECVAYTVPLIQTLNCGIMIPTPFSKLK
ncbi:protein NipSnap-like isoform X2 [Lineus longissimus]|uniref:protein NipSnap-like isoform X2 n=1 Tax=Lineus longissimus TaxID=88925 RepID=UPI00315D4326